MVSEHSFEENPIPQQSKKKAQGEQQASDSNQYICIICIEAIWSSAWSKTSTSSSQKLIASERSSNSKRSRGDFSG